MKVQETATVPDARMHSAEGGRGAVALLDALGIKGRMDDPRKTAEELDFVFQMASNAAVNELYPPFKKYFSDDFIIIDTPRFYCLGDTLLMAWFEEKPSPMLLQRRDGIFAILMGQLVQMVVLYGLVKGFLFRGAIATGEYVECGGSGTVGGRVTMGNALSEASMWYDNAEWAGVCLTPTAAAGYEVMKGEFDARYGTGARKSWDIYQRYDLPVKGQPPLPKTWVLKWHETLKDKRERIQSLMLGKSVDLGVARKMQNTLDFFDSCTSD